MTVQHTDRPTREAPLKWVVIIDETLPAGRAANAAVCVAAATVAEVPGLLGPDAKDAGGERHPGLPWAGCTVLAAPAGRIAEIRAKAGDGVFVADMPVQAQTTRIYDEYLQQVAETDTADIRYHAISLVGPRNRISKLAHRLPLLQ